MREASVGSPDSKSCVIEQVRIIMEESDHFGIFLGLQNKLLLKLLFQVYNKDRFHPKG